MSDCHSPRSCLKRPSTPGLTPTGKRISFAVKIENVFIIDDEDEPLEEDDDDEDDEVESDEHPSSDFEPDITSNPSNIALEPTNELSLQRLWLNRSLRRERSQSPEFLNVCQRSIDPGLRPQRLRGQSFVRLTSTD